MKKRMMLIDGSSLIHRAFYALPLLTNKDGIYTNGVYGFMTMFNRLMEEFDPDYLAVAFDRSGPTFRHKDYEAYKGNRSKTPSELASQFGILKDLLQSMRVTTLDLSEYEADDICGTLAKEAKEQGMEVFLVTGDKDYFQLVDEDVMVLLTRKGISETEHITPEKIKEDYGIEPKQFIEVKGLMGDHSDNIPGVPGIGEKRALQYIQEYGNLENLYDHVDEISGPKTRQSLIDNQSTAFLSRKLGEIFLQAPVDLDLEKYRRLEPDKDELNRKLDRLDMRSLMTKKDSEPEGESVHLKHTSAREIKASILEKQAFSYLFFFDKDYILYDPSFIAIATDEYYSVMTVEEAEDLFPLFGNSDIRKTTYDVKESYCTFLRRGLEIRNYEDVMILAYLVNPGQDGTLQRLSQKQGYDLAKEEEILGKGKSKKAWKDVEKEERDLWYSNYLAILPKLNEVLLNTVVEREMAHLYYDVELPLARVLAHMEYEGFCIDQDILNQLGEEFNARLRGIENEIYALAGEEFNINSPKQLSEILFEKLKLPVIKKTKTGYSTNVDVLNKLKGRHPIITQILEYRTLSKLVSTYIDGLRDEIQEDGKIHSHFNQTITATGRISSTEPNLQNIPVKTEEGRRIRKAFVAPEGMELLDGDYSQIELRVLAHLAQDETMLRAFEEGLDIHAKTAAEVFHVDVDEVTSLMRSRAKAVNFGIVYGISDYGLSQDLDITRKEAKLYIDKYLDTYPSIKSYMHDIVERGKKNGYVETLLNRRRYIPELKSRNFNIRSFGERVALNTPIQGSAADIIKIAMVRVFETLETKKMKSKLILQVHDELILQVPKEEAEKLEVLLLEEMENAVQLSVQLKVDSSWGKSWYEAK